MNLQEEKNAGLARYIRKLLSETRRTDGQLFHLLVKQTEPASRIR